MKRFLLLTLVLIVAAAAAAEDNFGLWRQIGDDYVNSLPIEDATSPFTLHISIHESTSFSIGGYEVGITMPEEVLILSAGGPSGWTNFGDPANQLVGFMTPVPAQEDFLVVGSIDCLAVTPLPGPAFVVFGAAEPPSIPGHDGPVYADGAQPDVLVPCGFFVGTPEVFYFSEPLATEPHSLSDVKALFE